MINEIQARTILKEMIPTFNNETLKELILSLKNSEEPT